MLAFPQVRRALDTLWVAAKAVDPLAAAEGSRAGSRRGSLNASRTPSRNASRSGSRRPSFDLGEGGLGGGLVRAQYLVMHKKIVLALEPETMPAEAAEAAEEDWLQDSEGALSIDKAQFDACWLELADMWTNTTQPNEYADFLEATTAIMTVEVGQDGILWLDDAEIIKNHFRRKKIGAKSAAILVRPGSGSGRGGEAERGGEATNAGWGAIRDLLAMQAPASASTPGSSSAARIVATRRAPAPPPACRRARSLAHRRGSAAW